MRYPAQDTAEKHQRLVDAASRLFRERGVEQVSVREAMAAAGMTHGAFPAHFASKDALACAALEAALAQSGEFLSDALADPATAKETLVNAYLGAAHRDRPGDGCAMAALAADVGRRGAPAERSAMSAHVRRFVERLAAGLRWRKGAPAREEAFLATAALVGALVLARAVDDPALSDEILAATRSRLMAR